MSERFKQLMRDVIGGMPVRQVAERAGIHRATVYEMLKGNPPRPLSLAHFCDSLAISTERRAELFEAAGYRDPRPLSEPWAQLGEHSTQLEELKTITRGLVIANQQLEKALRFYADPSNYDEDGRAGWWTVPGVEWQHDEGQTARAALGIESEAADE